MRHKADSRVMELAWLLMEAGFAATPERRGQFDEHRGADSIGPLYVDQAEHLLSDPDIRSRLFRVLASS